MIEEMIWYTKTWTTKKVPFWKFLTIFQNIWKTRNIGVGPFILEWHNRTKTRLDKNCFWKTGKEWRLVKIKILKNSIITLHIGAEYIYGIFSEFPPWNSIQRSRFEVFKIVFWLEINLPFFFHHPFIRLSIVYHTHKFEINRLKTCENEYSQCQVQESNVVTF